MVSAVRYRCLKYGYLHSYYKAIQAPIQNDLKAASAHLQHHLTTTSLVEVKFITGGGGRSIKMSKYGWALICFKCGLVLMFPKMFKFRDILNLIPGQGAFHLVTCCRR